MSTVSTPRLPVRALRSVRVRTAIAQTIRALAREKRVPLRAVAASIHRRRPIAYLVLVGVRPLYLDDLWEIATALGITASDLFLRLAPRHR